MENLLLKKTTYQEIAPNNIRVIIYEENPEDDNQEEEQEENDVYEIYFDKLITIKEEEINRIYKVLLEHNPANIEEITNEKITKYLKNNIYNYNNQYIIFIDVIDPVNNGYTISKTIADEILKSANTTNHSGGGINKKFKVLYNDKNKKYYINYDNRKRYLTYKNTYKNNKNGKFYMKLKGNEIEIYI